MNTPDISRRKFLGQTLAAAAITSAPELFGDTQPPGSSAHKFCAFEKPLQFLTYDELADWTAELGFDGVEATVRPGGHVLPENVERDLPRMHEALQKRGREITILTSGIDGVDSPHAETVLRTAAKLGIKRYRLLWYKYDLQKPILPQLNAFAPKLKGLAALNRELGLTALYQNHSGAGLVGAPLWDIFSLVKEFAPREISLAFDIHHAAVEGGLSWPVQFQLVRSHLGAVFVKDFVWDKRKVKDVPLGEGQVDPQFFSALKKSDFHGPISLHVEYFRGQKDCAALTTAFKKDFATLKEWLKT